MRAPSFSTMAYQPRTDRHATPRVRWPGVMVHALVALLAGIGSSALADEAIPRAGGIFIGTYQHPATPHGSGIARDEVNAQLELHGTLPVAGGAWHFEVRGSTTPRTNGVSSVDASNATVGETLGGNGEGRIAVTQLYYRHPAGRGHWRAGLLDPTDHLDAGDMATDEYTEFMADAFVHNLTIGFPRFVLGVGYGTVAGQRTGYSFFLGSDRGLEDGPHTYGNVFVLRRRHDDVGRGAFAAAEINRSHRGYTLKAGAWYDSGCGNDEHTRQCAKRYGAYFVGEMRAGRGRVQARAGIANPRSQSTATFVSLAFQRPLRFANREGTMGIAVARTGASHKLSRRASSTQFEAYLRIHVKDVLYLTPDIQYIAHPGFDPAQAHAFIIGVRAGLEF